MIRPGSPRQRGFWLSGSLLVALVGCATPEPADRTPGDESGGSSNTEGGSSSGGAGVSGAPSFGGGPSSGGTTQGGAPASGGAAQGGSGGTKSSGGAATSGGTPASGGSAAGSSSGGASSKGGSTSSGGATQGGAMQGGATSKGGSGGASPASGGSSGSTSGGSGGAGTSCSGAAFCDDFEDGNSMGWTPTGGTWAVTSDGTQVYSGGLGSYLSTAGSTQTNQTVQVRMKVLSMNSGSSYRAGIVARVSGSDHYTLALDGAGDFRLLKGTSSVSGASGTCAAVDSGLGSVTGAWMTLRMVVSGSAGSVHITTFRDTTQLHDCTTTSGTLASGSAGVMTYGTNTRAAFDDFRLSSP